MQNCKACVTCVSECWYVGVGYLACESDSV